MTGDIDVDFDAFDALTFDCYGTLIDWETGLLAGLHTVLDAARRSPTTTTRLLETYAGFEAAAEAGPYLRYRDVLGVGLRGVCETYGIEPTDDEVARVRRLRRGLAGLPGLGGGAGPAAGPLPARRHHQLRRRPVRGLEPEARRRRSTGSSRPSRPAATSRGSPTSSSPSSGSTSRVTGSCTWPRACSTTTCRPRRLGMTTVWIDRRHDRPGLRRDAAGRRDARTSSSRTWRPSPPRRRERLSERPGNPRGPARRADPLASNVVDRWLSCRPG